MKQAFLFAGQGAQKTGMGKDLYEAYPSFRDALDQAEKAYQEFASGKEGYAPSLLELMFEGEMEELSQTRYTQPALAAFAAGMAAVLRKNGIRADFEAGLSLGEYSALYDSGVFDLDTLIQLVCFRGLEMEKASEGVTCSMSALLGIGRDAVKEAVRKASPAGKVEISNYNSKGQAVIAGEEAAVQAAGAAAKELGAKRCVRLAVSGPFHTSFMEPAGRALEEKFKSISFQPMQVPVVFNCTGKPLQEGQEIPELLVRQVQSSVYMEDTILFLQQQGVERVIEIGPGKVLGGFVRRTAPGISRVSLETAQDVEKFLAQE